MFESLFPPRPFWFADEELLTKVLRKEVNAVTLLRRKHPNFPELFDNPAATVPQRKACFMVLAHRKIMDIIYEKFAGLYKESPSVSDEESNVISATQNLVAGDAPAWVLEMNEVVELLPSRFFAALPEPLRTGAFYVKDSAQREVIESAAIALSTVEQIQALTRRVLDQQLRRLEPRWSAEGSKAGLESTRRLGPKKLVLSEYSIYMDNLTEKQAQAFSLKFEYGLKLSEIASQMGIDRKTAYEHIKAARRKLDQVRSGEKRKAGRARKTTEF